MAGDTEWKSADQGEKLKLLLEERRSDSEKAQVLIELLETGFFTANSQLESEDDSEDDDDDEDETLFVEYGDVWRDAPISELPSSASFNAPTRPIRPVSPIPTSAPSFTQFQGVNWYQSGASSTLNNTDHSFKESWGAERSDPEGAAGLVSIQDDIDYRTFGGTFQTYAPVTSPLPPPADEPEAWWPRVAGSGGLARLDAQIDEADIRRERWEHRRDLSELIRRRGTAQMPGNFGDDIDFASTLAAGPQSSEYDDNLPFIGYTHRRYERCRDSPTSSKDEKYYIPPPAETVTDLVDEETSALGTDGLVTENSVNDHPSEGLQVPLAKKARKRIKTGCLTCRRRRIKCDEGKPTCNNCIKSKRDCEGYVSRLNFKTPLGNTGTFGAGAGLQGIQWGRRDSRKEEKASQHSEHPHGRESSVSLDPHIAHWEIKPALDPEYGDLLPLPPSEPGSPISPPKEDLPELPDSRPDTPLFSEKIKGQISTGGGAGDGDLTKLEERLEALEEQKRKEKEAAELLAQYKAKVAELDAKEKAEKEEREREFQRLMQERLIDSGLDEKEIQAILKKENIKREEEVAAKKQEEDTRPVYMRMGLRHLEPTSLDYYQLDWEYDTTPGYVLVKRFLTEQEREMLWEHTRRIRTSMIEPHRDEKVVLEIRDHHRHRQQSRQSRRASRQSSPSEPGSPVSQSDDDPSHLFSRFGRFARVSKPGGQGRKTWLSNPLSWARKYTLNLSRRVVRHLEKSEQDPDANTDDLAYGEYYGAAASPRDEPNQSAAREVPFPEVGLFVAGNHIPPPTGDRSMESQSSFRKPEPDRGMGGGTTIPQPSITTVQKKSEFEAHLRAKMFKPPIKLTTYLPEPDWVTPGTGIHRLFWETEALTRHSLLPLGQFIAEREREMRETLKEIELGVGLNVSGFGVEVSSKGFLPLLKPYQWINMWRNVPREMYVCAHPGGDAAAKLDMEKLHELENELMSSVKYQCGESEYINVITYSDDVKSGAVALLKAEFGKGGAVTGLRLEARFKDMPREICRMLSKDGNPNRIELRRVGRTLSCRARGKQPAPRPAAVSSLAVSGRKEWTTIGGGWRRALHITLHDSDDLGSSPREGLVATVPQMLALLHLRCRLVDCVPSTPIFTFEPPLRGRAEGLSTSIRRGMKLLGPPSGASHVGNSVTIAVLFSRESRWVTEQLFWA